MDQKSSASSMPSSSSIPLDGRAQSARSGQPGVGEPNGLANGSCGVPGGPGLRARGNGVRRPPHAAEHDQRDRTARVPLQVPRHPELFDTEEEWRKFHEEEKSSNWTHLPLVLVALPPLGAIIHGRAENWADGIILLLCVFYLYQLIKVPWSIYYASHARYILETASIQPGGEDYAEDPVAASRRREAVDALRRTELLSLAATMVVPSVGSYLLYFVRGLLSDPDRYINRFVISLFAMATAVKPLLHFTNLLKNRSLYYQQAVQYPSTEVYLLRRRFERLENELAHLSRAFATKDDVRMLRDGVDIPLSQLSRAVRKVDRDLDRLNTEERFALLNDKLDMAAKEVQLNTEMIERLRQEQEEAMHPIQTLFRVLNHVIGKRYRDEEGQPELRWYERGPFFYLLLPVNVANLSIEWVSSRVEPASNGMKSNMLSRSGQRLR